MSHTIQKDWELLAVVQDGNLKKNRNTKNVKVQEKQKASQDVGIQREIKSCDLVA